MTHIESFLPLSPMQEGMLFHTLYAPEAGEYFKRVSCVLDGRLDTAAFKVAWERVIERHSVLRTSFVWEGVERAIQVVHKEVSTPWLELDWTHMTTGEQDHELERFLQQDSEQGFKLNKPPLMRFAVMHKADECQQFVWSFHHLLFDGWSVPLILKEVFAFYNANGRSAEFHLETPRPYGDYVAWLQRQDLGAAERFWKQYLKGFTTPTKLGTERSSRIEGHATYASLHTSVSVSATAQILAFARQAKVTLSSLGRAAWALLLSRYSGESDVVFGATVSGRPLELPGVASMIGLFINTIPVRVNTDANELLGDFVQRLHAQQADLREYEHSPLAEIQKWSGIPAGEPLFQSILVFENYPETGVQQGSLRIRDVDSIERTSYPLTLLVNPGKELHLSVHYDTRRFDGGVIARILEHFKNLLERMTCDQPIHSLSMVREAERRNLIESWNNTAADYPQMPVYRLIEEQVAQVPERVAVVFEGRQLTYAEVNRSANQLAHYLRAHGVKPGSLVGICAERSLEMVIGLLGIMKAGGGYVPFDLGYPKDRLAFMVKDAQAPLVLTQEHLLNVLPEQGTQIVCLDRDWTAIAEADGENSGDGAGLDDLAYCIYTSGSTGAPKGAMNTHRGLCNRLWWMQQRYGLRDDDRVLQKTPFSFDVSVWEFFWPLLAGATLVVARPGGHQDPAYLVRTIRSQRITTLHFVPSMLQVFLQEPGVEDCDSLRRVICSGEALSHELEQQFFARHSAELHNLYGPTEASIDVTSWECARGSDNALVPIGRPISNTQIYILDKSMSVVPVGVAGELYIGGVGVAKGYWNRPELTRERFIADPFSTDPGARLYKTGDLARYRADGAIEFLGRMDHQIKIRGLRVELGEIEATLLRHSGVQETVVVAREHEGNDIRLVAYFVASERSATPQQLREFLGRTLPEYMIPAAFVQLDAMPLSANGKLDRRALPEPKFAASPETRAARPRTASEDLICAIWMDVLKLKQVGVHDNFFELGGHSLLAMQIASRVAETFGVEIALKTILGSPTVAGLSRAVEAARESNQGMQVDAIKRLPHDLPLALSFAQQRLWFLHQMEPNLSTYILPIALRLRGDLQVDVLTKSLKEVVSRHAALRTRFMVIDGTPMQCVEFDTPFEVSVVDLSGSPESARESEALRLATEESQRPFDLAGGLPIRASILRLSDQEHILLVTMHHIAGDDWSIGVFIREITALYQAFCAAEPSPLSPLTLQYADFAQWQRDSLKPEVLDKKLAYWKEKLAGPVPVLDLPTDRPRPAVQTFKGASEPFYLDTSLMASLRALTLKESATLFIAMVTSLDCLLHRYSKQNDIIVGSPVAGRTRVETEGLIGFFINTLPLRCDLSGDPSFRELLNRVKEVILEANAHQDVPFEIVVDDVQPERDLSRTPIYQVMVAPQTNPFNELKLCNVQATNVEIESQISKFDITLHYLEEGGEVRGTFEYNTDIWNATTMRGLVRHFERLLRAAIANPDLPVSRLPLLSEEECSQILMEWNETVQAHPQDRNVADLFEEQAEKHPERLAVATSLVQLSYRELNERANQLAHYLKRYGVGPEVLVCVCMQRSVEMVVALLAILKAGAAYVPLDPAYPAERLAFMLADASAPVLLTQQELLPKLPATTAVICLDREEKQVAAQSRENPARTTEAHNLAYVIYTSGSTGTPKGVAIEHCGLLNLVYWHQQTYDVSESDRATQLAAQAFDASVWELWPYLTAGASVHIPDEEVRSSPAALMQWLAQERITLTFLVTPLAEAVLEMELPTGLCLKALLTGGDRLHGAPQRDLPFRLMNHYGPTENTVVATYGEVQPHEEGVPTIGRPISNTQVYVLDERLQPVPVGVAGELYIGGASLARGYYRRPELTAQSFVPNPFDEGKGTRLYKTGDLVRYRNDGTLEFLRRVDDQVKIRGFRIELGEIETVLQKHPEVREAVALARQELSGHKQIVAYVVVDQERMPSQQELRAFLSERLPFYMVPSQLVLLDSLPLTPNGKVNREALPAPEVSSGPIEASEKPRTLVEQALAEIWSEVLKRPRIALNDNFFELGGDSILSIRVSAKAQQLGLRVTAKQIFQHQTLAELASVAERLPAWIEETEETAGPVPLTPIQRWFFEQNFSFADHFNQAMLLEVHRKIDPPTLKQAICHWISRHDALRFRFRRVHDAWQQLTEETQDEIPLAVHNLSEIAPNIRARTLENIAADLQKSLNLSNGPLIAVAWFDMGDEPARLFIAIHHLVVDAVSWRILVDDFVALCEALWQGRNYTPAKAIPFRKWAEHLVRLTRDEVFASERAYWYEALSGNFASLPTDCAADMRSGVCSEITLRTQLDGPETHRLLTETPSALRCTVHELLLAALASTVRNWTGSTPVLVDVEGHGREEISDGPDCSRTVGWFTTIVPIPLASPANASSQDILRRVKERLRSIPHRGLGYGVLRYLSDDITRRQLENLPHGQLLFNYLGQFDRTWPSSWLSVARESTGPLHSPQNLRPYLLEVSCGVHEGQLLMEWRYSEQLHRKQTIEHLAQEFLSALRELNASSERPESNALSPSDFSAAAMSETDLEELFSRFNLPAEGRP